MEPASKRLCDYHICSYRNYKVNAFLDYMMTATDEEKHFWAQYCTKFRSEADYYWEWIKFGECIRLRSSERESFEICRFSNNQKVPIEILNNPWPRTEQEKHVYSNADITFWHLIFLRLETVEDVLVFSQVSRVHYRVARRDMAYQPWINKLFNQSHYYSNPFKDQPVWSQFLKLSGLPAKMWNIWIRNDVECFFFAITSNGGHGITPTNALTKFDPDNWMVFFSDTKESVIRKSKLHPNHALYNSNPVSIQVSWVFRANMEKVMRSVSL